MYFYQLIEYFKNIRKNIDWHFKYKYFENIDWYFK